MKKATLTILMVIWAVPLLIAQGPPSPPDPTTRVQHHVQFLTTVLSLTAPQQQQATTIFTSAATTESAVFEQMQTARQSLSAAVKSNNAGAIEQAAALIGSLTAQLTTARAKANAAFFQLLTPDQQAKLAQLESERPRGFGGPGHMAPGPMGPPPID